MKKVILLAAICCATNLFGAQEQEPTFVTSSSAEPIKALCLYSSAAQWINKHTNKTVQIRTFDLLSLNDTGSKGHIRVFSQKHEAISSYLVQPRRKNSIALAL